MVENVEKGNIEVLIPFDQLTIEMQKNAIFRGLQEGPLTFNPTYKFDKGATGDFDYDSSEKQRVPAWTDRIFFRGARPAPLPATCPHGLPLGAPSLTVSRTQRLHCARRPDCTPLTMREPQCSLRHSTWRSDTPHTSCGSAASQLAEWSLLCVLHACAAGPARCACSPGVQPLWPCRLSASATPQKSAPCTHGCEKRLPRSITAENAIKASPINQSTLVF